MDRLHCCGLYDAASEITALAGSAVAEARRLGMSWAAVSDNAQGTDVLRAFPTAAAVDPARFGMSESPISVQAIVANLKAAALDAVAAGQRGLLLFIDMGWLLNSPSGVAHQAEFEAALHHAINEAPLCTVCLYHMGIFPDSLVLDAMRIHPFVCSPAGLRRNPHFLPPATFLSRDPGAKMRAWLNTLGPPSRQHWRSPRPSAPATPATVLRREAETEQMHGQRWKIRCFGDLRIYRDDGSPVHWNQGGGATVKTKTLFAYLLRRGDAGAGAEEIADLLWPGACSTEQSLNRLYHTVHCLRMALSPELTSSRASQFILCREHRYYCALPEGSWMDVPVFEEFCRRGEVLIKAGRLEESLACHVAAEKLYSGRLFADIPPEYADNVDNDWCWSHRYWLEEIYVKMLATASGLYRRMGDAHRAVEYGERALKVDPCYEPAHQQVMQAFHEIGRKDALERQYRLCCAALKRYEERPPSGETRVLYQRLAC